MNKEEIILEKISYEELQDKYINESTTNYVLEKQNNRLQQENKQLKNNWEQLKNKINSMLSNKRFADRIISIVLKNILEIMQ